MALSQDLINQFVKLTDKEEKPKEVIVNGTYRMINGEEYVQIDGSEIWTPVTSTVEAETGERVKVMIKNHTATVTGNISSPSARSKSVKDLKDEVDEQGNTIKQLDNTIEQQGNSIIQIDNNIKQVNNDILQANNAINQQGNIIKQLGNEINQQGDIINSMNNDITTNSNEITAINNTIVQQNNTITQHGNIIEQQGNVINQQGNVINEHGNTMEIFDSNIRILNSGFIIENGVLTGLSEIVVNELETEHLNAKYANIDFSNINYAAVKKIFSESGIIKDLIVQEGKITGELVGVTIKGDLIEGNTIKADKLVVKGEDGLYYKLNIDGLDNISTSQASKFVITSSEPSDWNDNYTDYYIISNNKYVHVVSDIPPTWQANTYYKLNNDHQSGLDGTVIIAKSITADKVQVSDLVAFGATIGGFNIGTHSIYSGVKNSVNNTTRGIYMDDSGQVNIGDSNNFLKYFLDTSDNTYKLKISAGVIEMGGSGKTLKETLDEILEETTCNLVIESSRGTVFKSNMASTILSVVIYRGKDRITNMTDLRTVMGNNIYLQWKWRRLTDNDWGIISASDSHISDEGFKYTITPDDIDNQVSYMCELIKPSTGRNLLLNSSFEKDTLNPWFTTGNSAQKVSGGYNSNSACEITISETGTITPRQNIDYLIPKGETVTCSVKIKTISGNADNLVARIQSALTLPKISKTDLGNGWYLYVYQAKTTSNIDMNNYAFGLYQTTGTFILDEFKLELGEEATDWSPAPEDD